MFYIPTGAKYSAIQFTGDNREKIARFLGLAKENVVVWRNDDDPATQCHLQIFSKLLNLGKVPYQWWIVMDRSRTQYLVISDTEFGDKYEKIGDE